ncbi:5-formaminoimidazole-4-carboxamide-1-(beta)-D-ribofuranosyl 5'-monophosphate synthetase [Candidatus Roizmanbacteria bacterium CG23_combo_of_CG06-09_8_20_14_all_35_49]|uniref:5-formaminoimidazole-4-carboxamide-1-(Beta)-D-ribofuranosyl 5'-monophosphate synthetase n=1 Tax=Candidatus Roizmanbacteria bacterium CG23_combo_of_CG06-09_8_20_14_all_35_49 TaxID=1974863 RepID=A0A2G9Y612_9BACT|nr:MAG: 5-formaminoimidazole-4-carboxamide-1-(beta)-D-ribofuranosyl 5'-monophosphate synthetase [Candidatus Roizmanbacteria bacterium CG23_combo_of_CG06-09_8_20_14_all_35_49]
MNVNQVHVGTLGGHSALEIALGAKMQGLKAVVVCQKGREKTYTEYYADLFDEVILVDKFRDLTTKAVIKKLQALNTVMVQSRYFWVYCDHEAIEKNFPVPIFGRRGLVKREERNVPRNQYYLMDKAGIRRPKIYQDPRKINRLVLVKAAEATRTYERAFFLATSYKDYQNQALQLIKEGRITKSGLKQAVIEEFILGVSVNFNFFYSPLKKRLELLGTDTRRATNINGLVNLPANEQLEILKYLRPQYVEAGHMAVTVKESVLEQAFTSGEKLVKVLQQEFPPGIIGPFALQTIYVPGPPKEDLVTFDLSLRMPGSPGIIATPYSNYLFGRPVSLGERIAMEIRTAIEGNKLELVVS